MATGQSSYSSTGGTTYYDLTTDTGDRAEINDALFFQNKPDSSSGTGLIQAIVRVQDPGGGDGTEDGYNTSFRPLSYEENTSPQFTTSLLLSEVPIVEIDGQQYYEFRLDINQLNSSSLLSLDALKVYISDVDDGLAQGTIGGAWFTANADEIYNLDGTGDTSILLDASLSSGSGSSDLFFYIPVSSVGAVNPDDTYVTLYSQFGTTGVLDGSDGLAPLDDPANTALDDDGVDTGDVATAIFGTYTANDGFEEWSVSKSTGGAISGYKFEDSNGNGLWDDGEEGLGGWSFDYEITYDEGKGNNVQHVVVDGTVTTSDGTMDVNGDGVIDPAGFYSILVPLSTDKNETYTITLTEIVKAGWTNTYDGDATPNATTTFTFSKADLTTSGDPASPNISGHFETTETMNFGNFELFDISGTKYEDVDGDGVIDAGVDLGLAGWTIFIDADGNNKIAGDTNEDGVVDAGETWTEKYAFTDGSGNWSITGLDASYDGLFVKEVLKNGWVQTLGPVGSIDASSGNDQTDFDFANFELYDISGTKYEDMDGDGTIDAGVDLGLAGWTIFIDADGNDKIAGDTNEDGVLDAGETWTEKYAFTDSDGNWSITGLDESYDGLEVKEILKNGWVQTLGPVGTIVGTSGNDQDDFDFANFELFDISGTKYNDVDGDGEIDAGVDLGLAGWTIFIDADGNDKIAGDTNEDGVLDAGETWTEKYAFTDSDGNWSITGLDDSYNGLEVKEILKDGYIQTLGPVGAIVGTSGNDQDDFDFANFLPDPSIDITKYVKTDVSGTYVDANVPDGPQASTSTTVYFKAVVTNDGNESLSGITITDTVDHDGVETDEVIDYNLINAEIDIDNDGIIDGLWSDYDENQDGTLDDADGNFATVDDFILAPGDSFAVYYSLDSALGQHENTAAVEAVSAISDTTVTDEDDANYYVVEEDCVGVRTPGFWSNPKWMTFWDGRGDGWGTQPNEPSQAGTPGFASGELLYATDSNDDGFINFKNGDGINDDKPFDGKGLLIGDYNMNGLTDVGEDTLFISLDDAKKLINASEKQIGANDKTSDGIWMLGRDMVATWLNYLANNEETTGNCIGTVADDDLTSVREYLNGAIDWMQGLASDDNNNSGEDQSIFQFDARVAPNSTDWQSPITGVPYSGSEMHSQLDFYNNTGKIYDGIIEGSPHYTEYCCDADSAVVQNVLAQIALI